MSTGSTIQWTDHTFNPWWGCIKIAQGCKNCYAEGVAQRFHGRRVWGPNSERRIASEKVWNDPHRWNKAALRLGERGLVFCLSMGDVLEDHPALVEPRKRLVGIIEDTPNLEWQLLTKRPENAAMFGWGDSWPDNVWFGASAAIQPELDQNVPHLFASPAPVRFLSLEPLVGPMDLRIALCDTLAFRKAAMVAHADGFFEAADAQAAIDKHQSDRGGRSHIDWVIVGGESGRGARPCNIEWIREIVRQCKAAGVACFVKQFGSNPIEMWNGTPQRVALTDPKGGDIAEWPEDLRVREFPR